MAHSNTSAVVMVIEGGSIPRDNINGDRTVHGTDQDLTVVWYTNPSNKPTKFVVHSTVPTALLASTTPSITTPSSTTPTNQHTQAQITTVPQVIRAQYTT
ncbi:unnamed protein product [Sphacelaria rigidula]